MSLNIYYILLLCKISKQSITAHYIYKLKCSTLDELITDSGTLFHYQIAEGEKEQW